MICTQEQLKELIKYSDVLARKFFYTYRTGFYLPDSKDLDDLYGEGREAVWLVVREEKNASLPFEDIRKICGEMVRLRMMKLKVYSGRRNPRINNNFSDEQESNIETNDTTETDLISILKEDLVSLLGEESAKVLIDRELKKKSFKEIGDEMGFKKQWAYSLYINAKKYLLKKLSKETVHSNENYKILADV